MSIKKPLLISAVFILALIPLKTHAKEEPKTSALGVSPAINELILEPGEKVEYKTVVFNITNFPIPIKSSVENLTPNEPFIEFDQETKEKFDASSWFLVEPADFILQPKEEKEILISINPPFDAEPGGHYATVFFQPLIPQQFISNRNTNLMARVGVLNFLIVKGEIIERASISKFETQKFRHFGPVEFDLGAKNEGNVHILTSGKVVVKNVLNNKTYDVLVKPATILPKTERPLKAVWDKVILFGYYTAEALPTYGSENTPMETDKIGFWVIPVIPFVIISIILTAFSIFLILYRYRLKLAIDVIRGKVDNKDLHKVRKKGKIKKRKGKYKSKSYYKIKKGGEK